MKVDRFRLLYGPYRSPKVHRGSRLFCEIRGTVIVGGFRFAGEIPWPYVKQRGCPPILCGDLVKAIRCESKLAVMRYFGLSKEIVRRFRRALNVPAQTDGTRQLQGRVATNRKDDRLSRARRNSKKPAALAKLAAKLKGRVIPSHIIQAVREAAQRPRSLSWKKKMAEYWRKRGHPPGHPESRFWTAAEDAILGTAPDAQVAKRIKRSVSAIYNRRGRVGIPRF